MPRDKDCREAQSCKDCMKGPQEMAQTKSVFVTVGTTKFDALIQAVDQLEVVLALAAQGFDKLTLQIGAGSYVPMVICPAGQHVFKHASGFEVEWFRFAPSLKAFMQAASLVISHAGAGSLFEALQLRKAIVAVPNSILMANHQTELAEHLANLGHLVASTPEQLTNTLQNLHLPKLQPYEVGDPAQMVQLINEMMGIQAKKHH